MNGVGRGCRGGGGLSETVNWSFSSTRSRSALKDANEALVVLDVPKKDANLAMDTLSVASNRWVALSLLPPLLPRP